METTSDEIAVRTPARPGRASSVVKAWHGVVFFVPLLIGLAGLGGLAALMYAALPETPSAWFAQQGIDISERDGFLAGVGAVALLLTAAFVALSSRHRALLRIRGALQAFRGGERSLGALRVADRSGAAKAWNDLLDWRDEQADAELVGSMLRAGGNSGTGPAAGESAADALWQGVIVIDEQQVIRYANGAAAVLLRQRRETLSGTDFRRVMTDRAVQQAVEEAVRTGSRQRRVIDTGDASTPESSVLRFSVRSVGGAGGDRSVLVVVEDVTQQRVSDAAQHAFVAQATHELRTPLTNMRLYVEQLIDDDLSPKERGTALNVINQEISRLDRIVGDMLSIAEIQAGGLHAKSGEVRVHQLFEQIERDYAESARQKNLRLEFDLPPKFPTIFGDREKIGIVLHNLLGNAVKYTPDGGAVRVVVHEEGDRLVTEVTDTGIGIGEEDIGRIFERFVRANDARVASTTGTGLGLALARDIARLHNGDITVTSQRDVGSTFSFWLPISTGTQARAA